MKVDRIVGQSSRPLADILRYRATVYESSYDIRVSVRQHEKPQQIAQRIVEKLSRTGEFTSTRGYDRAAEQQQRRERRMGEEFVEVVRRGLAPDRGLFVAKEMNAMALEDIGRLVGLNYHEKAMRVMERLPLGSLHPSHLRQLLYTAYSTFTDPHILPVTPLHKHQYLMETFHGPTASFKDLSLQLLPQLLTAAMHVTQAAAKQASTSSTLDTAAEARVALLVATSGDTGTAALDGFGRQRGNPVVVLYPKDGVSVVQKKQMQTAEGDVLVLGVDGDFGTPQRTEMTSTPASHCQHHLSARLTLCAVCAGTALLTDFCQTTVKDIFNDSALVNGTTSAHTAM